jgi:hypothetical protein
MHFYGNLEYAIQSIGFKEITFLHSDKLNDPFDPHFFFTTDFNDNYPTLTNYVQEHHAKDVQKFRERLPQENWKKSVEQIEDRFNSLRNSTFLFSTSAVTKDKHPKDSLYMWSHYGNGHRGVVIEFNTALLTRAVLAKMKSVGGEEVDIDEVWCEINYTADLPKITSESIFQFVMNDTENPDEKAWDRTELSKIIRLMERTKSMEWKTEDEWRLMWGNDETKLKIQRLSLLDDTITAIYLGCRIDDHVKDTVIFETKHSFPNAKIFRGKKAKGRFALVFDQLS